VAVLLVDFLAAMAVITFGLLYAKVDPVYLALLSAITFILFFVVSILLTRSDQYVRSQRKPSAPRSRD
jgi:hypothetical protein